MTQVWVIGSNGLLGKALCRALQTGNCTIFQPAERFNWNATEEVLNQIETAVKVFTEQVGTKHHWQIYWAAGIGIMSSTEAEFVTEIKILSALLGFIESRPELMAGQGSIIFASSAGAIYAGATDDFITENTPIAPTTAYAREKLKQESLLTAFANKHHQLDVLLARISTLYGSDQANGKRQGLLAEIARRIVRNQPIQIYVPFDTIRDYITADDAATKIIASLNTLPEKSGALIKIIASEKATSIAEIISVYKRLSRRTPRVICNSNKLSSLYSRCIQFRSVVNPHQLPTPVTTLVIGISRLIASERLQYIRSK